MIDRINDYQLNNNFLDEKIKDVIFNIGSMKILGLDGFFGYFFQHFWYIIKSKVITIVKEFQVSKTLPLYVNSIFFTLISKLFGANEFSKF